MFSYGEKITVCFSKMDENKTILRFNSRSKLGTEIAAQSKNRKNIEEKKTEKLSKKELHSLIQNVEMEMKEAAKNLDFERATELRDILFELRGEAK